MQKKKEISNWGNFPTSISSEQWILNSKDPGITFNQTEKIIPRGNGRCYGDASLGENIVSTRYLTNFLELDEDTLEMECESGVLFSDLLDLLIPKGLFLPVTPGTKFITVGGAVAADVHGKNHHKDGCFSSYVISFQLLTSDHKIINCSKEENSELFWQTIGGMGLTGIILRVRFRLLQIETSYISQESIKAKNLDEIFDLFEDSKDWKYTVAWIDCLQKKKNLGRSVLLRGEHASIDDLDQNKRKRPLLVENKKSFSIPFFFPAFTLNWWTVKIFNLLYFYKQRSKKKSAVVSYNTFFYPLDSIEGWNKIYGKKGFIQYQFVVPLETSKEVLREILELIAVSRQASFLAVLKLFGENSPEAINSFPMKGYTLALDFKVTQKTLELVPKMDAIILKHKGRIYRAKDCVSDPRLTNYLQLPESNFESLQSIRINSKI
ncbi:MAG: FAD-binding oxidoreductase [Flavobacteriaceae bacterium]|nr:FAD-binding oxidoreductase [Flavobacteriaceae bacterium]NNM10234.1 FAD-binding oxidoreductase [Flavobacteriaceae bacterium]